MKISDPERFFDIIVDEFIEKFTEVMQRETLPVYLENFSEQELSDIAAFYATTSGQKLINATPMLMQAGATIGEQAGKEAFAATGPRVADLLEAESITVTEPSMTQKLLDALR